MTKIFEDSFSELQADMVSISLEYASDNAENIFIYSSFETMYYFDFFYKINNSIIHKHKLNEFNIDVSEDRQDKALEIGINDLEKIHQLFKEHQREMPTEMKLIYDVKANSLAAEYSYDLKYSNTEDLLPMNLFDQWFDEVAAKNAAPA